MRSPTAACLLALAALQGASAQDAVPLTAGMVIERSVTIRPGTYRLASPNLDTPVVTIRGENVTVDFNGARLVGAAEDADPDTLSGLGVLVDGGSRVTLKHATIRGFKVAVLARRSPGLRLSRNDLSYNWKQRLQSRIERESLADWMSYHQNEKDEWLRYGAAMYLTDCDRAEIDHNVVLQGQNGLMVTRASGLKVWNNTFQFLSSIGVGLYRVTTSTIQHNRIDWCVRGYSHGYYNRGQDSAGLLMYEQSSHNVVAYNSITHGGDGLFLWAGQSTMDTGKGGSNDNVFYGNDFSHAPTNGIEATFSRNTFVNNRVEECWHGVWGGYSYDSVWAQNRFARNTDGVAIEHGQGNEISGNSFEDNETAIRLWQNPSQDPNWAYPKFRDTRSRAYFIERNRFLGDTVAVDLRDTTDVRLRDNVFARVGDRLKLAGDTSRLRDEPDDPDAPRRIDEYERPAPLPGGIDPTIKDGERRGRKTIVVDEWGPYDWRSPKLWPVLIAPRAPTYEHFQVLGPEGQWRVASARGATVAPRSGRLPAEITVTPAKGPVADWAITLEYRGGEVVSPRGLRTPAGQPYRFSYSRYFVPVDWRVKFFAYTDESDPIKRPEGFAALLAGPTLTEIARDRLDYVTSRPFEEGVPRDRFAASAEGTATLPPGEYVLHVGSDDGVRVWMDGRLVLDAWEPHGPRTDTVPIPGGRHTFRLEYYEIGGFSELTFTIQKRKA